MPGFDGWLHPLVALIAALTASAANTVAGGGTVLSFPVLIWMGLPPIEANSTNSVGLFTGSMGGAWSYRGRLSALHSRWVWLWVPALAGGAAGAWLVVNLPPTWFAGVAPLMVIGASLLVAGEPLVRRRLPSIGPPGSRLKRASAVLGVLAVSTYGGGWVNRCVNVSGGVFPLLG